MDPPAPECGSRCCDGALNVMAGKLTPISVPNVVLLSWKNDPVDSVSRSEEEMEEMEGEEGGGTKSLAGSSIVVLWICGERERERGGFWRF